MRIDEFLRIGRVCFLNAKGRYAFKLDRIAKLFMVLICLVSQYMHADAIHDAVESKNIDKVKAILVSNPELVNAVTEGGSSTPLHLAVGLNDVDMVSYLLKSGADINAVTKKGFTPLHWAAYMNAGQSAAILVDKGANVEAKTITGVTAFQIAVRQKSDSVVKILVTKTPASYTDHFLDVGYVEGKMANQNGDLARSYEILTRLIKDDPKSPELNFAYGLTCFSLGDYSRASLAYERVIQAIPGNDRAKLELARCYVALKQYTQAEKLFREVRNNTFSDNVKKTIDHFLNMIKTQVTHWRVNGNLNIGYTVDDNVNVGPDSNEISIFPIIFGSQVLTSLAVSESSQPLDSAGYFTSAGLNGLYDIGTQGDWVLAGAVSFYENWLDDSAVKDYEVQYSKVSIGTRLFGARSILNLPLSLEHITLGGDALVDIASISPTHVYVYGLSGDWQWVTGSSLERRSYDSLDDRDGFFVSLSETMKRYFGNNKHYFSMGVTLSHDFTDASVYEYTGRDWYAGIHMQLPYQTFLYSKIGYQLSRYEAKETLAPDKRVDNKTQYIVGINKEISSRVGVDVSYQITDNNSTFGLYQYNRNLWTIRTYCSF